jgi:hypothetical protein
MTQYTQNGYFESSESPKNDKYKRFLPLAHVFNGFIAI